MAAKADYAARLADIRDQLDGITGHSIRDHETACRLHFESWSLRARMAEEQGDMRGAARASKEAREWSTNLVRAAKATISDRLDELRDMLEAQRNFSRDLVALKCQTSPSGDTASK